jgi:hypothetical protein
MTTYRRIASAAADVKGLRCTRRKNRGAPLTAASLRLGGSYGELPLPVCKPALPNALKDPLLTQPEETSYA